MSRQWDGMITLEHAQGEGIIIMALPFTEETAIPPYDTTTRKAHMMIPGPTDTHYNPHLVPAVICRVLNPDLLANTQPRKGLGMRIILYFHVNSTSGTPWSHSSVLSCHSAAKDPGWARTQDLRGCPYKTWAGDHLAKFGVL